MSADEDVCVWFVAKDGLKATQALKVELESRDYSVRTIDVVEDVEELLELNDADHFGLIVLMHTKALAEHLLDHYDILARATSPIVAIQLVNPRAKSTDERTLHFVMGLDASVKHVLWNTATGTRTIPLPVMAELEAGLRKSLPDPQIEETLFHSEESKHVHFDEGGTRRQRLSLAPDEYIDVVITGAEGSSREVSVDRSSVASSAMPKRPSIISVDSIVWPAEYDEEDGGDGRSTRATTTPSIRSFVSSDDEGGHNDDDDDDDDDDEEEAKKFKPSVTATKEQAEAMLKRQKVPGSFLMWENQTTGNVNLSMVGTSGKLEHHSLKRTNGMVMLDGRTMSKTCTSLQDVVQHLTADKESLSCTLRRVSPAVQGRQRSRSDSACTRSLVSALISPAPSPGMQRRPHPLDTTTASSTASGGDARRGSFGWRRPSILKVGNRIGNSSDSLANMPRSPRPKRSSLAVPPVHYHHSSSGGKASSPNTTASSTNNGGGGIGRGGLAMSNLGRGSMPDLRRSPAVRRKTPEPLYRAVHQRQHRGSISPYVAWEGVRSASSSPAPRRSSRALPTDLRRPIDLQTFVSVDMDETYSDDARSVGPGGARRGSSVSSIGGGGGGRRGSIGVGGVGVGGGRDRRESRRSSHYPLAKGSRDSSRDAADNDDEDDGSPMCLRWAYVVAALCVLAVLAIVFPVIRLKSGAQGRNTAAGAPNGTNATTTTIGTGTAPTTASTATTTLLLPSTTTTTTTTTTTLPDDLLPAWPDVLLLPAESEATAVYTSSSAATVTVVGGTPGAVAGGTHSGGRDAFVLHISKQSGELLWSVQLGTPADDHATSVAVDEVSGDVIVGGGTQGSLYGPLIGEEDAFAVRLDAGTGAVVWSSQVGSLGGVDNYESVAVHGGIVYATGQTRPATSDAEVVVAARNATTGQVLWTRVFGSNRYNSGRGLAVDKGTGNVFVSGRSNGPVADGASAFGRDDGFVVRLVPAGNDSSVAWATHLGTGGIDRAMALAVDDDNDDGAGGGAGGGTGTGTGDVFVVGQSFSDWSSGDDDDALVNQGSSDVFVVRVDASSGAVVWTALVGSSGTDVGAGVAVANGTVYVAALIEGGLAGAPRATETESDVAVLAFDAQTGAHVHTQFVETEGAETVGGIAVDAAARMVYVVGSSNAVLASNTPDDGKGRALLAELSMDLFGF